MRIAKTFEFDAAHWLPLVPDGHKCKRVHGHTYRVTIVLEGNPGPDGMILDYAEVSKAWEPIQSLVDHQVLNEVSGLQNPTVEVLAPWVLRKFFVELGSVVHSARVYESATTWCEVTRDDVRLV